MPAETSVVHVTEKRKDADLLEDQLQGAWPVEGSPVTLIGYWEGDYEPGWPNVTDFVDEHWAKPNGTVLHRT